MKKKTKICKSCKKEIRLFYTGNHEGYSIKNGNYYCGGCM